jgi:hypothetical protein
MDCDAADDGAACCRAPSSCAFDRALLSRSAACSLSCRQTSAEREWLACTSPVALTNCTTLLALMRERSTFVLRLQRGPLRHAQSLRLQCGGVQALRAALDADETDVHALVLKASERFGSLVELPWPRIVQALADWQPRRRGRP